MTNSRKSKRKAGGAVPPAGPEGGAGPARRGGPQTARFDLGHHARVLEPALGPPPPGYGLTIVRGWIRAPGRVVAAWDVNDPAVLDRIEQAGWGRFVLRVLGGAEQILAREVLGRRGGTHHLQLTEECRTIRLVIGLEHDDGFFQTLARSSWVRMPPPASRRRPGPVETAMLAADLDRRALLRGEPPARAGHLGPEARHTPGARLADRLRLSLAATGSPTERAPLEESRCDSGDDRDRPAALVDGAPGTERVASDGGDPARPLSEGGEGGPGSSGRKETSRLGSPNWGPTSPPRPFGGGPSGDGR